MKLEEILSKNKYVQFHRLDSSHGIQFYNGLFQDVNTGNAHIFTPEEILATDWKPSTNLVLSYTDSQLLATIFMAMPDYKVEAATYICIDTNGNLIIQDEEYLELCHITEKMRCNTFNELFPGLHYPLNEIIADYNFPKEFIH